MYRTMGMVSPKGMLRNAGQIVVASGGFIQPVARSENTDAGPPERNHAGGKRPQPVWVPITTKSQKNGRITTPWGKFACK